MRLLLSRTAVGLALTAGLVGCGGNATSETSPADTAAPRTSGASNPGATPSEAPPTPSPPLLLSDKTVTSDAGYTWDVHAEVTQIGPAQKDISQDRPGRATLVIPVVGTISVTHTTPGREAPDFGGPRDVQVTGLYESDGPWCGYARSISPSLHVTAPRDGKYCSARLITYDMTTSVAAPGEARFRNLPEEQFASIAADLTAPDYLLVSAYGVTSDRDDACVWTEYGVTLAERNVLDSAPGHTLMCENDDM